MNQDIRAYVASCDVCQKIKHTCQGPIGLLQPLPIPNGPFEVITMDFITELPPSKSYDAILVIVDKLTKYGHFIPMQNTSSAKDMAHLVFSQIISHYGLPLQIISDHDRLWTGLFWKEICFPFASQTSFINSLSSSDGWSN